MFDEDFGATLLGAAAVIGLPAAVIVAGTVAFTDIKISMPSFAKADPIDTVVGCYNEIIDTKNKTECGFEIMEYLLDEDNAKQIDSWKNNEESMKAKWSEYGVEEHEINQVAMVVAFNGVCSDRGNKLIQESAEITDPAEQFGMDLGLGMLKGLRIGAFEKNIDKLEKIG